jgi:hypothetical protein
MLTKLIRLIVVVFCISILWNCAGTHGTLGMYAFPYPTSTVRQTIDSILKENPLMDASDTLTKNSSSGTLDYNRYNYGENKYFYIQIYIDSVKFIKIKYSFYADSVWQSLNNRTGISINYVSFFNDSEYPSEIHYSEGLNPLPEAKLQIVRKAFEKYFLDLISKRMRCSYHLIEDPSDFYYGR